MALAPTIFGSSGRPRLWGISSRGCDKQSCLDHDLRGVFRNRLAEGGGKFLLGTGSFDIFQVCFSSPKLSIYMDRQDKSKLAPDCFSFRYSFVCRFKKIIERTLFPH